jgi:hypothetical protein
MSLAAHDSEFRRWSGGVDRRICQTSAASPAEPGELPLGFSMVHIVSIVGIASYSGSRLGGGPRRGSGSVAPSNNQIARIGANVREHGSLAGIYCGADRRFSITTEKLAQ